MENDVKNNDYRSINIVEYEAFKDYKKRKQVQLLLGHLYDPLTVKAKETMFNGFCVFMSLS